MCVEVYDAARDRRRSGALTGRARRCSRSKTYRHYGHFEGDPDRYRDDDDRWRKCEACDPLRALRRRLVAEGVAGEPELETIDSDIARTIADAVAYAKASPWPDPKEIGRYVYAREVIG